MVPVTVTSTVPLPAGEVAVIWVDELTVKLAAAALPKLTAVAPVKLLPVMVTVVPPDAGPPVGLILVTAGTVMKVNWSAAEVALVPFGVVTMMSFVPLGNAGVITVIWVSELTVKLGAPDGPNPIDVAPVKLTPVMVTAVPPDVGPLVGLMPVTIGAAV